MNSIPTATIKEVAAALNMSEPKLIEWSKSGRGPLWLISEDGEMVIPQEEVERFRLTPRFFL